MSRTRLVVAVLVLVVCASAAIAQQPPQPIQDGPMMGISMMGPDSPNLPPGQTLPPGALVAGPPMEGAPAEAAGLLAGDVIVKIDGKEITGIKSVQGLIPTYNIGDTIEVTYMRGAETRTTKITLGSRKAILEANEKRILLVGLPMPAIQCDEWINGPFDPANLKGKVVVVHFFEMLCAGSLGYSLPRVSKWHEKYGKFTDFALVGVHSTWEMQESQTPDKIKEFVQRREYKYPIGIDHQREQNAGPATLWNFRMATEEGRLGTPGIVIVDKKGIVRFKKYGNLDDAEAEKLIDALIAEPAGG